MNADAPRSTSSVPRAMPLLLRAADKINTAAAAEGEACLTRPTGLSSEIMPMETERTPSTRAILDSSTEFAIILTDTQGHITIWNEGGHRIMGWTSEEMVGQSLHRIFTPE